MLDLALKYVLLAGQTQLATNFNRRWNVVSAITGINVKRNSMQKANGFAKQRIQERPVQGSSFHVGHTNQCYSGKLNKIPTDTPAQLSASEAKAAKETKSTYLVKSP